MIGAVNRHSSARANLIYRQSQNKIQTLEIPAYVGEFARVTCGDLLVFQSLAFPRIDREASELGPGDWLP